MMKMGLQGASSTRRPTIPAASTRRRPHNRRCLTYVSNLWGNGSSTTPGFLRFSALRLMSFQAYFSAVALNCGIQGARSHEFPGLSQPRVGDLVPRKLSPDYIGTGTSHPDGLG